MGNFHGNVEIEREFWGNRMKRLFPIAALVIVSVLLPQQIHAAPQAKAGTKCSKANATQLVGAKKFTCIKSGAKLVWNKGIPVPKPVTPSPAPTQISVEPSPTVPSVPASIVRLISGAQTATEKVHYVNNLPRAKRIIRWPNQSGFDRADKIVIVYENMRVEAPPCDLSKALCQSPSRVDTKVYFEVIGDVTKEVFTLEDLAIDAEYDFGVYAIQGVISEAEIVTLSRRQFFLAQASGLIPDPPTGISVGAIPGSIRITSTMPIEDGYKLLIIVIGGKFGSSTTVATFTAPQEVLVPAPNGYYVVTARLVTPSGINGSPGQTFDVTLK